MLDKIITKVKERLVHDKEKISEATLRTQLDRVSPEVRTFKQCIVDSGSIALIAEVKKASPSKGLICAEFDPLAIARSYFDGGATAISVLTEIDYFQGHLSYLKQVSDAVPLPVLRKDFIVDSYQLYQAKIAGASAVLLIVAALRDAELKTLLQLARRLQMDVLVEVHDRDECQRALAADADIIGINNRNLKTFEVDLNVTTQLLDSETALQDVVVVSESGIANAAEVTALAEMGVDAVLVGETLMRQDDRSKAVRQLLQGPDL